MTQENYPIIKVKELFQVGVVVSDLQKSMQLFEELLGIDDWAEMEIPSEAFDSLTYKGKPVENACFLTGMANVGPFQIELIQPVEGDLPYSDFLKEHGGGLHHIGHVHVPNIDEAIGALEARGYPCIFAGATPSTKFAYVDMSEALGVIVEMIEDHQAS
ncbi:MAG: VOC family protein [Anaerolineales bacterium]|nr:VOC family protein [Anaerolineales bacterium]